MITSTDAARNIQAATTLAAGIAAPAELRAQLLQQIIETQSYAGLVQTVSLYMNGRNQLESTASLIQHMAVNAFAVRLGSADLNTLVAAVDAGQMTFGDVAVLAVTGIKSSAWVQTFANKLAAAEQLTNQLVASGKSADYNSAQTYAAVREWLGGVGFDNASGNAAKASIGSLLGRFDKGSVKGLAMDGYVAGASVLIDSNGNGVRDNFETASTTGAGGAFQFAGNTAAGTLVLTGGTDIATGLPMLLKLTALAGAPTINPLTTLVQTLTAQGLVVSVPEAESKILAALKLPALDLSTYDPIAAALQAGTTRQEKADAAGLQSRVTQLVNTLCMAQSILEPLVGKSAALQDALWLSLATGVFNAGNAGLVYPTNGGKAFTDLLLSAVTQLKGAALTQTLLADANTAKAVNAASETLATLNGLAAQAAAAYASTQTASAVDALSDIFKIQTLTQSQVAPLLAAAVQGGNGLAQLVNFPLLAQLDLVKAGQIAPGLDTTDGSAISNVAPPPPPPPVPEPVPAPLPPPPAPAPAPVPPPPPPPPPNPVVILSAGTFNGRAGINDEFTLPVAVTSLLGITINGNAGDTDVLTLNVAGTYVLNDGGAGGTISNIKAVNLAGTGANTISFPIANNGGITTVIGGAGNDSVNLANTGAAFRAGTVDMGAGQNTLTLAGGAWYIGTLSSGSGTTDTLVMYGSNTDISGAAVTGFENLSLIGSGPVIMTAAQLTAFTGTITGGGTNTLNLTTAGTIVAPPVVENFNLANGTNTFTAGTNTVSVTGGTGADTFNYTASQVAAATRINGGAGADTLNIGTLDASLDLNSAGVSNIEIINATGSNSTGYFFTNENGAGVTLNFTKGAVADRIQLGSGGQTLNVSGAFGVPVRITGGNGADTVNLASLFGVTLDGTPGGSDVLNLTGAGAYGLNNGSMGGTINNIEVLNLADTGTNVIEFARSISGLTTINGGAGDDTVNLNGAGNALASGVVDLGEGVNTLRLVPGTTYTGIYSAGTGTADTLVMPDSNNDLSAAAVTGFENLTLIGNGVVTLTAAQLNALTGTIVGMGNNTMAFTTAGTIVAPAVVENFNLANGTNTFTAGANTVSVTGDNGADTFNYTASQVAGSTSINGGAGADTLNIGAMGASLNLNSAGVSNIETINATGSSSVGYTFTNENGAGVVLNFAKGAAADTIQLGSGGQTLNLSGTVGTTVTITGGSGADTINLAAAGNGRDIISAGSNNTAIDTIANFNTANDVFKTGVSASSVGLFTIGGATTANYLSIINGGLVVVLNNTNQAYFIDIQTGSAAGKYLFQNTGFDRTAFDSTDFFVQLVGLNGSIAAANIIA